MVVTNNIEATKAKLIDKYAVEKMPAHWLMASLGKKVLRPGGIEMTRWLLENSGLGPADEAIEFAPGLGITSSEILTFRPKSYTAIESDESAANYTMNMLAKTDFNQASVLLGDAAQVPLPDASATFIVGEAMLSMQTPAHRQDILAEAHRLLRPGGLYAVHELAIVPDDIEPDHKKRIQKDISHSIRVGVNMGTISDWKDWLKESGFDILKLSAAPMRLLEPERLVSDEGLFGTVRFIFNTLKTPGALRRLRNIRSVFRTHANNLRAVAIIARRK